VGPFYIRIVETPSTLAVNVFYFKVSAIAAGTAGVLTAARVLAAAPWLIHILGLIALVARVALLGVLPGAALLGGVLVAASAASGTLSW
jgi:uncharacterized membrane protein YecN with MAPEG domain